MAEASDSHDRSAEGWGKLAAAEKSEWRPSSGADVAEVLQTLAPSMRTMPAVARVDSAFVIWEVPEHQGLSKYKINGLEGGSSCFFCAMQVMLAHEVSQDAASDASTYDEALQFAARAITAGAFPPNP